MKRRETKPMRQQKNVNKLRASKSLNFNYSHAKLKTIEENNALREINCALDYSQPDAIYRSHSPVKIGALNGKHTIFYTQNKVGKLNQTLQLKTEKMIDARILEMGANGDLHMVVGREYSCTQLNLDTLELGDEIWTEKLPQEPQYVHLNKKTNVLVLISNNKVFSINAHTKNSFLVKHDDEIFKAQHIEDQRYLIFTKNGSQMLKTNGDLFTLCANYQDQFSCCIEEAGYLYIGFNTGLAVEYDFFADTRLKNYHEDKTPVVNFFFGQDSTFYGICWQNKICFYNYNSQVPIPIFVITSKQFIGVSIMLINEHKIVFSNENIVGQFFLQTKGPRESTFKIFQQNQQEQIISFIFGEEDVGYAYGSKGSIVQLNFQTNKILRLPKMERDNQILMIIPIEGTDGQQFITVEHSLEEMNGQFIAESRQDIKVDYIKLFFNQLEQSSECLFSQANTNWISNSTSVLLITNANNYYQQQNHNDPLIALKQVNQLKIYDTRQSRMINFIAFLNRDDNIIDFYIHQSQNLYYSTETAVYRLNSADITPTLLVKQDAWYNMLVDSAEVLMMASSFQTIQLFDLKKGQLIESSKLLGEEAKSEQIESMAFAKDEKYLIVNIANEWLMIYNRGTKIPMYYRNFQEETRFRVKTNLEYVAVFNNDKVQLHKIIGPTTSYDNFFSFYQLLNLRKIITQKKISIQDIQEMSYDINMRKFYFNTAVISNNQQVIRDMIAQDIFCIEPDYIILNTDPISYTMNYNQEGISRMIIQHCTKNNVYNRLYYRCGGYAMRDFLFNFFQVSNSDYGLPQYGDVKDNVCGIYSNSPFNMELKADSLPINIQSDDVDKIYLVFPKRPIDFSVDSQDLQDLLLGIEDNLDSELLNSNASLLIYQMKKQNFQFFVIEGIVRIILLGFIIASIYIRKNWAYITAIILLIPITLYQIITSQTTIALHFSESENILDAILILLSLANSILGLTGQHNVLLAHIAVFVLYVRCVFSLRFIKPIRRFLQVLVNITIGVIPFFSILILFTLFGALDGYLVPNPQSNTFETEFIETMQGVYIGQVATEYLAELDTLDRITKWMIVMTRQIILNLFFLNGILIGIVANIYSQGEQSADIIGFSKIISTMREFMLFYRRLPFLAPKQKLFLHAFVTNLNFKKKEDQSDFKSQVFKELAAMKGMLQQLTREQMVRPLSA